MVRLPIRRISLVALVCLWLPACTTMQTTYFRASYVELAKSDNAALLPDAGKPRFALVDDMKTKARAMYGEGYAMLGYSQFVSPLLTSLAEDYSTKWGAEVGAAYVVLESPRQEQSNLNAFLVTYWSRTRTDRFSFGAYVQDLPEDLLKRIGEDLNVVILQQVIEGTPAAAAGFRADDVILAVDGVRVLTAKAFSQALCDNRGGEIEVSVYRSGEQLDLPVKLAAAAPPAGPDADAVGYREAPWLATRPTDWSGLSAAAFTASAIQNQQRMEKQRQLDYERAQAQAQRNLNELNSRRISALEQPQSSRRRGDSTLQPHSREEQALRYKNFTEQYRRNWNTPEWREMRERQETLEIWFHEAPGIYRNLYHFPRPRVF